MRSDLKRNLLNKSILGLLSAEQYVESDPSGRSSGVPIATIKQGNEPLSFTGWFLAWDPDMWDQDFLKSLQERLAKH